MSKLFDNPGDSVKVIARVLFSIGMVVAAILLLVGVVKIISALDIASFGDILGYTIEDYMFGRSWEVDGYIGKVLCKSAFYVALASLSAIPLFAFGVLVEDISQIKQKLVFQDNDDNIQ